MFLTNNRNALPLYEWVSGRETTYLMSDRLRVDDLRRLNPKLAISYNYNYLIQQDCIDYLGGSIINLHISLLPWNRGFSPNIWSFIDDTPKGVTIHKISAGLDEGDILFQRELHFDPQTETFESTYNTLNDEIVRLFQEHWPDIHGGKYQAFAQKQAGIGTYHTIADLQMLHQCIAFEWSDNIAEFLARYRSLVSV